MSENNTATGVERAPCGCVIDHRKKTISPCEDHVLCMLAKLSEDNGGKISFAK